MSFLLLFCSYSNHTSFRNKKLIHLKTCPGNNSEQITSAVYHSNFIFLSPYFPLLLLFILTPHTLPHSSFFHPYSLYNSSFLIFSSLLPIHFLILIFHPYSLYTSSFLIGSSLLHIHFLILIFSSLLPIHFLIPHFFILTPYTLPHSSSFHPYSLYTSSSSFFHPYSLYNSSFLIGSSLLPIHFLIPHFFIFP